MEVLADGLAAFGKGAGIAVDTAKKIVTYTENTHAVLEKVELAGGVTVLVKTGATLLVKEGIKACVKAAAKEVLQNVASAVAANIAGHVATMLGLSEDQQKWLKIGLDSYQAFAFFKAAKTKIDPNGNCFVAGTGVLSGVDTNGYTYRKIEDIKVGDYVLSRDENDVNDDLDRRRVTNVFRKTSNHLRVLTIRDADGNTESIKTTNEHPFHVEGKGWTNAGELQRGAVLDRPDGSDAYVISSAYEAHPEGIAVFNFEVEGDHTYFVEDGNGLASAVWVHNICVAETFYGRYKGKPIEFNGVSTRSIRLSKVSKPDYDAVVADFETRARPAFLKGLAGTNRKELKKLGFSDPEVTAMAGSGTLPAWAQNGPRKLEVHHIHPKDLGGTNDFDNLLLIRQSPHHSAISSEVAAFTAHMERGDGQSIDMDLPTFGGMRIYDP